MRVVPVAKFNASVPYWQKYRYNGVPRLRGFVQVVSNGSFFAKTKKELLQRWAAAQGAQLAASMAVIIEGRQ